MWKELYMALTAREGVYICYLVPILYVGRVISTIAVSRFKTYGRFRWQDGAAVGAILLIALDFIRYLFLLLTHTGRILPFSLFLVKYAVGLGLWGWCLWYCYVGYFSRRAAREQFSRRWMHLVFVGVEILILILIGRNLCQ